MCFRQHVFVEGGFNSSTDLLPSVVRGSVNIISSLQLTVSMFADVGSGHRDRDRRGGLLHAVHDPPAAAPVRGARNPPLLLSHLLLLLLQVALLPLMRMIMMMLVMLNRRRHGGSGRRSGGRQLRRRSVHVGQL